MDFGVTVLFYLLAGAGVAAAVFLADGDRSQTDRLLRVATAVLFWPLYLPILLSHGDHQEASPAAPPATFETPTDDMAQAIMQADAELDAALESLDGLAEEVLARETVRIGELKAAWTHQARRVREMDRLLERLKQGYQGGEQTATSGTQRVEQSDRARKANIQRLQSVRNQAYDDLTGTIAWVRELTTMIHLAKFTGAPASRAEELVSQIAAAVHGLSEAVRWEEESEVAPATPEYASRA